jgi:hypothetical protein
MPFTGESMNWNKSRLMNLSVIYSRGGALAHPCNLLYPSEPVELKKTPVDAD